MLMVLAYAGPLLVALAGPALLRWRGGAERVARWGGVFAAIGFFVGWQVLVGPDWIPKAAHDRIGHIVLGAALIGIAIDVFAPRPWVRGILIGVLIAGSVWISVAGGLSMRKLPPVALLVGGATLAAAWAGTVVRFEAMRDHPATVQTIALMALIGVAIIAFTVGDAVVAKAALAAALAWIGHAIGCRLASTPGSVTASWAATLVVAAALFGGAWAMAATRPATAPGLAILLFMLFADQTARRVPMPGGRISDLLYVLVLAAMAAIPLILAIVVTAARLPN